MSVKNIELDKLEEDELLNIRICDLPVHIEGTWLEKCVSELYKELDVKGIFFKPPCYLADEWLTPDQEPVIGIPFYLAHPALIRLEKKMMLEAEGESRDWCLKLLRHEAGHALNYAYKIHKRRRWQSIFGKFSQEYGDTYRFRPYSKGFVRHLEDYYAQYHPDEDFAETFSVWLTPGLNWENQYKGWKAIQKIRYVDEVMSELMNKPPVVAKGRRYWEARRMKSTLRNYYKRKKHFYREDFPDFHDENLKEIFIQRSEKNQLSSHSVIQKYRKNIIRSVSNWTGEKKYVTDEILKKLIKRCHDLDLVVHETESHAVLKISVYVTTLIMNYVYTGRLRGGK